jgi:membrane protein involved in colicin uptake
MNTLRIAPAFLLSALLAGCNTQADGVKGLLGRVCLKQDGNHYGIPDSASCAAPDKQVNERPSMGFLGMQARSAINYDTAKKQANDKTIDEIARKKAEEAALKKREEEEKAAAEAKRIQPAVDAYIRGRKENVSHEGSVGYAAEVLESQFGGHSYEDWRKAREYIAPKLAKYDTPEWEAKLKANRRPVDDILDRLTEVRKQATRRIVADRNLYWDSENDPVRLSVVSELKGVINEEIQKLNLSLNPQDVEYLRDQLNKQIESNL